MMSELIYLSICKQFLFGINNQQQRLLKEYVESLLEWNTKINLISRKDTENVWTQQILASTSFLFTFELEPYSSVIDIGTGGGLPGIPIAILRPDLRFVLIDSIRKKINAVQNIINSLGLKNVSFFCGRAEDLSNKQELQNNFDYVIARAVSATKDIIQWGKPFIKTGKQYDAKACNSNKKQLIPRGSIILLKGGDISAEIEEAKIKHRPQNIQIFPIVIDGNDSIQLFDKKIVIIKP